MPHDSRSIYFAHFPEFGRLQLLLDYLGSARLVARRLVELSEGSIYRDRVYILFNIVVRGREGPFSCSTVLVGSW